MTNSVEIFLGFDPGGEGNFGWSICQATVGQLEQRSSGVANNAGEVVAAVLGELPTNAHVLAAGIDAPLHWSNTGSRKIDSVIRKAIKEAASGKVKPTPSGTVIEINALRGACLVEGILLGKELLRRKPRIRITEAHPKALLVLLWLKQYTPGELRQFKKQKCVHKEASLWLRQCAPERLRQFGKAETEHQRDAGLAAYAAWCMHREELGWSDLFERQEDKQERVIPLGTPVSYWMPIP